MLAFRALEHHDPVEFFPSDAFERALDPGKDPRGPDIRVLVEGLADGELKPHNVT